MKVKSIILACSLLATMSASAQTSKGIDLANMNTAAKPGNDFYEYAIGGWRKALRSTQNTHATARSPTSTR